MPRLSALLLYRLSRSSVVVIALTLSITACDDKASAQAPEVEGNTVSVVSPLPPESSSEIVRLKISPEDLITLDDQKLTQGISITGSLQPERSADLRAEITAVVREVLVENGQPVKRGDLLVRLDDTEIRDNLSSAKSMNQAASYAYDQAERQLQRLKKLKETALVSKEVVEDSEVKLNQLRGEFESSKSRLTQARLQLQRTEVRAPFDGIVSARKVSAGDTSQIGKELVNLIDLGSLRFEGLVSPEDIRAVTLGQAVVFRVHGLSGQAFFGKVARINPLADATTRQIEVLVEFSDATQQPALAGLYTEGHITTGDKSLTIPASAVVRDGASAIVWRVADTHLEKVSIVIDSRDPMSGEFELKSGLNLGDRVLRYPSAKLRDGQAIELAMTESEPNSR